ncbi:hypothetical protein SAMN05428988_4166 [Chitinophaga sp. YR573]|uniref:hypothetical protein n=1 Tax=Chitinophaga sp. YR573 TaxID=1881040 RepID=UPI0008C2C9E2|nr:hypothetical protein [Chitinophaga sp. YR573]SEW34584.1 hypothetical protein SAMN05428988_4166 [Chitinophaga sp. YR573]
MAKKKDTRVRFLGGYAARKDLLGILSYPVGYDGSDVEHTRFFMVTPEKWVHRPIEADVVSAVFEDSANGKCWWLLDKRGVVHSIRPSGLAQQQIADAGTGPGKFGYLSSIKMIEEKLYACGYRRQVYEYTSTGWEHIDQDILLREDAMGYSLNDIAGYAGVLCAVGNEGEIALRSGSKWTMINSPVQEHLYAVCTDNQGRFYAAGANGTVISGDASGFVVLCSGGDSLWDIEYYQNEIVVSATSGLFIVRDGKRVPFDKPAAPKHVGYKLSVVDDMLLSIGTDQIFALENNNWKEWICPDNV